MISEEQRKKLVPVYAKRSFACRTCPTPCSPMPNVIDLTKNCPLPVPRWDAIEPEKMGLGDLIEILAKPMARILKSDCLDKDGKLKPESGCAKRRDLLNRWGK